MLRWALGFLVLALVAAIFGFGRIAEAAVGIGQVLFVAFLVMAAIAFFVGLFRGRSTV
jgi:uncharacterized membrane protein YtjA (UPF0391 family)